MNMIKLTLEDIEECKEISDKIVEKQRWVTLHETIFEYDGKFYRTYFTRASTEQQEGSGTDSQEELECYEVERVEKIVKVWALVAN